VEASDRQPVNSHSASNLTFWDRTHTGNTYFRGLRWTNSWADI